MTDFGDETGKIWPEQQGAGPSGPPPGSPDSPWGSPGPTSPPSFPGPQGAPPIAGNPGGYPVIGRSYPEGSQAVIALVISILGLVSCGALPCPIGWLMGRAEVKAIDAGRRDPANRGLAQAAQIVGLIGTILLGLGIALVVLFSCAAVVTAA